MEQLIKQDSKLNLPNGWEMDLFLAFQKHL